MANGVRCGFPAFFGGDRSIHVDLPNMPSARNAVRELREDALKEVVKGRYVGPLRSNPFPNWWCPYQPRNAPAGVVPKNKRSPLDGLKRPIANFSALEEWSVNALDENPQIELLWMTFDLISQAVAASGRNTVVIAADVKAAYRLNQNRIEDLHLHVHKLESEAHGVEFFVDLCNPFGFRNSYWNWESVAGVIKWQLLRDGVTSVCNFVDNFYILVPPLPSGKPDSVKARGMQSTFLASLKRLGLPMHEHQLGTSGIHCLGWIINSQSSTYSCPPERQQLVVSLLASWATKSSCSLKDLRSLTGLFYFISAGFAVGRPDLAAFFKLKTKAEATCRRLSKAADRVFVKLSAPVVASITFWNAFFPSWNGSAPFSALPSPCTSWHSIWRTDGSTSWGMGATNSATGEYISSPWTTREREHAMRSDRESAPFFELLAVLQAARSWAPSSVGCMILIEIDCMPAQQAIQAGFSSAQGMQLLLRNLRLILANHACSLICKHIPRGANTVADAFSTGAEARGLIAWEKTESIKTPLKRQRTEEPCLR